MPQRVCKDWLTTVAQLVRNTESPEHYWLWSGLYTLSAALERRAWVEYGLDKIYPNLYIILVSPPGKCRKGPPLGLSRRLLHKVGIGVAVDSTSKESLVNEMSEAFKQIAISGEGTVQQSPLAVVSKEFSSLLAVDAKKMIEFLTAIFDHNEDVWEYKVLKRDPDKIYGPCLGLFAATTPSYLSYNVPYEAFGDGFFSRVIFVAATDKRQRVAIPKLTDSDQQLIKDLAHDLNIVSHLSGPFKWTKPAEDYFTEWYNALDKKYAELPDERFHGFIERAHVAVLKTTMAWRVSYSDELVFKIDDIGKAIDLIEMVFKNLSTAFGALGRSERSLDIHDIIRQLKVSSPISFSSLYTDNWRNMTPTILREVIDALKARKCIKVGYTEAGEEMVTWDGEEEE